MEFKKLRAEGKTLPVSLSVGKNGISEGAIKQLEIEFKGRQLLKIKLLKSYADSHDRFEAAETLAAHTQSKVVQVIGNTILLYRPKL